MSQMAHKSLTPVSTQLYGLLSVLVLIIGIFINLFIRPDLFSAAIPYSLFGTLPDTKLIFSGTLLISGLLFWYESHFLANKWQRWGSYSVVLGFSIVAFFPINQNYTLDLIHGFGTFLALMGLLVNLVIGIFARRAYIGAAKRLVYAFLFAFGVSAAVISVLSGNRLNILGLQGFAEYSGLTVFAGWVLLDFGDKLTKNKQG